LEIGTPLHKTGVRVLAALADGSLSDERWRAYLELQSELAFEARKGDPAKPAHRRHWKQLNKSQRARNKMRRERRLGCDALL